MEEQGVGNDRGNEKIGVLGSPDCMQKARHCWYLHRYQIISFYSVHLCYFSGQAGILMFVNKHKFSLRPIVSLE